MYPQFIFWGSNRKKVYTCRFQNLKFDIKIGGSFIKEEIPYILSTKRNAMFLFAFLGVKDY